MTIHAEITELSQEDLERVQGGSTPTGKLYVGTNVGVFVEASFTGYVTLTADTSIGL